MQYPGGKGSSFQKIINLIPPHAVYIETHLGGGAVMRHKRPAAVNIGIDINREVLRTTAQSIAPGSTVINGGPAGTGITPGMVKLASIVRSDVARASSEVALLDGALRQPSPGAAGLPRGALATNDGTSCGARYFFLAMDALRLLEHYPFSGDEFIYADPPYLMETRRQQRPLYDFEYSQEDHVELLVGLRWLPCKVALSGYYSEMYMDMLPGWHTTTFTSQTRGGTPAEEWVWMNYAMPDALHQYDHLGVNYRERERIKRKKQRWVNKLQKMDRLERQAILWAISEGV